MADARPKKSQEIDEGENRLVHFRVATEDHHAGGREKHLPLGHLAAEVTKRCTGVVLFGESGPLLESALQPAWPDRSRLVCVSTLEEAVPAARSLARSGDIVLLSPACTSFDAYPNFEKRGEHFKALVNAL